MYKGTTPTFTLTLPETVDLSLAVNVYVSFAAKDRTLFEKTGDDLEIDGNVCNVFLSQEETLSFPRRVSIQLNWTYTDGGVTKRSCSTVATVDVAENLANRVLE